MTGTLLFASCSQDKNAEKNFNKLKKLEGMWESKNNIIFFEKWKLIDDSTLSGKGYSLRDRDTVFSEVLRLNLRNGKITYLAKDPDQNRGAAVPFGLEKATRNKFIFENLEHDYPNRITYEFEKDSLLKIRLETAKGTKVTAFYLRRM